MEAVALRQLTYREFREMEFDDNDPFQYELLDGEIMKKNAPTPWHQRLSRLLLRQLDNHVTEKKLGEVFYAPIDVFLNDYNAPQPDLIFVSEVNKALITNDGIMYVPDLVVEIISPSSIRRDRFDKRDIYERFAIPEYWIADPQNQEIEVYSLAETGKYELYCIASVQDLVRGEGFTVKSKVLPALQIDIRSLF
ncbi:Uma2 family endonuclease [Spirosoma soli]|uniref:Uma2 family endonuclease n=1 Tax=Spirosoma soli TaxID=1770529 RepID=A0ABW5LZY2_9BACT